MNNQEQNKEPKIITLAKKMSEDKKELESLILNGVTPKELEEKGYRFVDAIKL